MYCTPNSRQHNTVIDSYDPTGAHEDLKQSVRTTDIRNNSNIGGTSFIIVHAACSCQTTSHTHRKQSLILPVIIKFKEDKKKLTITCREKKSPATNKYYNSQRTHRSSDPLKTNLNYVARREERGPEFYKRLSASNTRVDSITLSLELCGSCCLCGRVAGRDGPCDLLDMAQLNGDARNNNYGVRQMFQGSSFRDAGYTSLSIEDRKKLAPHIVGLCATCHRTYDRYFGGKDFNSKSNFYNTYNNHSRIRDGNADLLPPIDDESTFNSVKKKIQDIMIDNRNLWQKEGGTIEFAAECRSTVLGNNEYHDGLGKEWATTAYNKHLKFQEEELGKPNSRFVFLLDDDKTKGGDKK